MSSRFRYSSNAPELVWVTKPETKIRFRYESEGGSHGGLPGKAGKKTYPTVELKNYHGRKQIIVRVSLHTEDEKPHVLEFKGKKHEGSKSYIEEPLQDDNTAVFKNLHILSKKKDVIEKILMERKLDNLKNDMSKPARAQFEKKYSKDVKERARAILNSVKLYFEAFEADRPHVILCNLYSDVICNQKAASKGDLRICRLSAVTGTWKGGDEVYLLCEKVQRDNIKVKFFETNEEGHIVWEGYGEFSPLDVHYQVAIPFKTPRYARNEEKKVYICLERNDEMSDPREFTYKPDEQSSKKRKIDESETLLYSNTTVSYPDTPNSFTNNYYMSSPDSSNGASGGISDIKLEDSQEIYMNGQQQHELTLNADEFDSLIDMFDIKDLTTEFQFPSLFNEILLEDSPHAVDGSVGSFVPKKKDKLEQFVSQMDDYADGSIKTEIFTAQMADPYPLDILDIDGGLKKLTLEDDNQSKYTFPKNSLKKEHIKSSSSDSQHKKKICFNLLLKRDIHGNTLLHRAVLSNKNIIAILKMSFSLKINLIDAKNHKNQTALHIAAETSNHEAVKILLHYGSNPNLKDFKGNNCYFLAACNNYTRVLNEINNFSHFPHQVCDINDEGLTPLHVAIQQKNPALFYLLKIHLTDPNIAEKKAGKSLLHYAVEFLPSILTKLLEMADIDVNIQDFEGNTPLHVACACTNIQAVKQLLQYGADPTIKNFKQNFECLDENCEDDTYSGQLPADLTTDLGILKLLRNSTMESYEIPLNIHDSENSQDTDGIPSQLTERLCMYLDEDEKWKKLAIVFLDENFIQSLNLSSCPAKALLNFIKKEDQDNYLERLKTGLEIAELIDGLDIINIHQHLNEISVMNH